MANMEINADLARERAAASFCREEVTSLWDGGQSRTDRRRYIGWYATDVVKIYVQMSRNFVKITVLIF